MKTKVVAFRVTEEEYDLLTELASELVGGPFRKLFEQCIAEKVQEGRELIKRQERQAKAKAKRDAKKAAANAE
jgi:hypothetical protein